MSAIIADDACNELGDPTKPPRHSKDLRAKRNPETERETQSAAPRLKDRCRGEQSADRGDDEAGHGEYGGCG